MSLESIHYDVNKMGRILSAVVAGGTMDSESARYRLRQALNDSVDDYLTWLKGYMQRSVRMNLNTELEWPAEPNQTQQKK